MIDSREIALALGITDRAVRYRAARESWPYTEQTCRGGRRRFYRMDDLPNDVRLKVALYQARQMARAAAKPNVAAAAQDVAPSTLVPPAHGGQPIPAGVPSPADSSPAATGADGLTGGGGADRLLVGELVAPVQPESDTDRERIERARRIMAAIQPLMALPDRHRGRRAMAEAIARDLGVSFQQVYRYEQKARVGGLDALVRMGSRADRGTARVVVSKEFEAWAAGLVAAWPAGGFDVARLADMLRGKVRGAWTGGANGERQCWLKATAWLAKDLREAGCPDGWLARLLNLPVARRFVGAEGQHFRVAGKSLRDGKAIYDDNLTPVRRTAQAYLPGDLVCGDISPLDIPCLRPDGSTMYARMISWHDVATNWLWIDLFPVEKGEGVRREHVAASFARMCEQAPFGAPKRLYLDNGSEYKWDDMLDAWHQLATLTGQQMAYEISALLPEAGRLTRSIPFHPRGKRIEGQFGNLRHWLAWWMGYVGGNRMTKKIVTLGKGVTPSRFEEVAEWLQRELADYHVTPQPRAEHMAGLSPQQKLEQALAGGWKPARIDRGLLMLAFSERQWRTVTHGRVSWGGRWYRCDALMGIEGKVLCAKPRVYETWADMLFIFDKQGRRIGEAIPEYLFGLLDPTGAKEAGRRRQALRLLNADKLEQAPPLDVREVSGLRAELLGLDATLQRAADAAVEVEPAEEARLMLNRMRLVSEQAQAAMRRAEAAKQAEQLIRLAEDDPEAAALRAIGF